MAVKAFPSCQGFGAIENVHGRGGTVEFVDNLNDSGSGSLRAALTKTYPRYIIPRVGGTIALNSNIIVDPSMGNFYFAGQVAPGGGLLLRNYQIIMQGHDIVMRYLRNRIGLAAVTIRPDGGGRDTNTFLIYGGNSPKYNICIDHCDASWCTDQNGPDAGNYTWNIIIQWCSIGEGTATGNNDPAKQHHNKGNVFGNELWMGGAGSVPGIIQTGSIHHNWYHSVQDRTPLSTVMPKHQHTGEFGNPALILDFRNNLIFNNPNNAIKLGGRHYTQSEYNAWVAGTTAPRHAGHYNIVGNLMIPGAGPNINDPGAELIQANNGCLIHARNNRGYKNKLGSGIPPFDGLTQDCALTGPGIDALPPNPSQQPGTWDPVAQGMHSATEIPCPEVTTYDVDDLLPIILANTGCIRPVPDSVLLRWRNEVNTAGGNCNITWSDYPTIANGTYPTHSQPDGIPDSWKIARGLSTSTNYIGVTAPNGYDWIENYLNDKAGDIVDIPVGHSFPVSISLDKNVAEEMAGFTVSGDVATTRIILKDGTISNASAGSGGATFS